MKTFEFFLLPGQPGSTLRIFFKLFFEKNFFVQKVFKWSNSKSFRGKSDIWGPSIFLLQGCPGWTLRSFVKNTNIQKSEEVWKSGCLNGFKCSNLPSVNEVWKFKNSASSRIELLEVKKSIISLFWPDTEQVRPVDLVWHVEKVWDVEDVRRAEQIWLISLK